MSGLFDQVVNYSPPLLTAGQVNYDGTWNAATNTPGLANPPDALSKGDYYVVSVAGTQFGLSFAVGDWIISNGTAWEKVDLTDAVSSVFGRTGAVVGDSTDYSAVGLTNTAIGASSPSTGAFTSLSSSSTTTLNGTTIPASKTLVVTTDKLSALAATTSAELAGVISDETGSGALVFASSPTLVTPTLGAATATSLNGVTLTGTSTPALSVTGTASVSGTNTGDQTTITGNAGTATILQTARNINGVSFNGSADITVTAAAGTLTGATLASGVTASSLTSLGTITSLTATALTVNDNTTLGSNNSDTVNFNARVASDLNPSTDNTYDLGVTGHEWRNLNIDGTANIDSLVADTADINGGTIDGTAIGATTPSTGAFTTLNTSGTIVSKISSGVLTYKDSVSASVGLAEFYRINNGSTLSGLIGTRDQVFGGTINDFAIDGRAGNLVLGCGGSIVATFTSTGLNSTAIGATTPSTGAFTTVSATGQIESKSGTSADRTKLYSVGTKSTIQFGSPAETITAWQYDRSTGFLNLLTGTEAAPSTVLSSFSTIGLGVGTASPASKLHISGDANTRLQIDATTTQGIFFTKAGADNGTFRVNTDGNFEFFTKTVNQAMVLTAAGNVGIGTASPAQTLSVTGTFSNTTNAELATSGGGNFVKIGSATAIGSGTGLLEITFNNAYYGQRVKTSNSGGGSVLQILKSTGTEVGLISHNDTVTVYGGTSDYRLKDITGPLTDSGTFIDALKPKVGTWKTDGSKFVGFIAHEFAEVSPSSVQGEKDAVDAEGNPKYQGMQASSAEVIANLVAELQSVRARLAALESK
jgi:hypothetical protein